MRDQKEGRRIRAARRFVHANARLRTRWGMELTWEEYEEANERFRTDNEVHGRQVNSRGDIEGWIPIRGKLIPCVYAAREGFIATFFAPPPGATAPVLAPSAAEKAMALELKAQAHELRMLRERVASLETHLQEKTTKIRELNERVQHAENRAARAARPLPEGLKEARWLKAILERAAALIYSGQPTAAFLLLDTLVSAPRAYRFTADEDATRTMLERRCAERVAHFAKET